MNRTGLIVALAIAAAAGLAFGLYPQLELRVARHFYEYADANHNAFAWRFSVPILLARDAGLWVAAALVAPAVAALIIKFVYPRRKLLISARAIVFLIATMALGPGLLVNVALKDHWGRPRPVEVTQFGGTDQYVSWWDPRGDCPKNCSFVSGDVAGAFWTLAPAALAPPQWRALAYGAALALGTGMSALRVITGGHFVTDAVFAGVFIFLIIWVVHGIIYRWPATRFADDVAERAIEHFATSASGFIAGLLGRKAKSPGARPGDE